MDSEGDIWQASTGYTMRGAHPVLVPRSQSGLENVPPSFLCTGFASVSGTSRSVNDITKEAQLLAKTKANAALAKACSKPTQVSRVYKYLSVLCGSYIYSPLASLL